METKSVVSAFESCFTIYKRSVLVINYFSATGIWKISTCETPMLDTCILCGRGDTFDVTMLQQWHDVIVLAADCAGSSKKAPESELHFIYYSGWFIFASWYTCWALSEYILNVMCTLGKRRIFPIVFAILNNQWFRVRGWRKRVNHIC